MPEKQTLADENRAALAEITKGTLAAFENAERLYFEATVLAGAKAYSRALFLHQISMEELAKVEALGALASNVLIGGHVDLVAATKQFTHHKAKNYINAYMLPHSETEEAAMKAGDVDASIRAFKERQAAFHRESNDAKNAALYVDLVDGAFVAPAERVTKSMVKAMARQNESFLGLMAPKRDMMVKWNENPDAAIPIMNSLKETMIRLMNDPDINPAKLPDLLMDTLMESIPENKRPPNRRKTK
ncbi:AbiV family abortive infection protein [Bradyrhizobium ganzhouense]|uniref:AbiV family abortive infection protein n=1 Tax=Bradyrhizobium ganzhouense TaxID=1179767 RepID=UPI003CF8A959